MYTASVIVKWNTRPWRMSFVIRNKCIYGKCRKAAIVFRSIVLSWNHEQLAFTFYNEISLMIVTNAIRRLRIFAHSSEAGASNEQWTLALTALVFLTLSCLSFSSNAGFRNDKRPRNPAFKGGGKNNNKYLYATCGAHCTKKVQTALFHELITSDSEGEWP